MHFACRFAEQPPTKEQALMPPFLDNRIAVASVWTSLVPLPHRAALCVQVYGAPAAQGAGADANIPRQRSRESSKPPGAAAALAGSPPAALCERACQACCRGGHALRQARGQHLVRAVQLHVSWDQEPLLYPSVLARLIAEVGILIGKPGGSIS